MRRCLACCSPLPRTHPLGDPLHPGCFEKAQPGPPKPYNGGRPRNEKRETIGRQILRIAMELGGEGWVMADNAQRLRWKRQAKLLILSHVP